MPEQEIYVKNWPRTIKILILSSKLEMHMYEYIYNSCTACQDSHTGEWDGDKSFLSKTRNSVKKQSHNEQKREKCYSDKT